MSYVDNYYIPVTQVVVRDVTRPLFPPEQGSGVRDQVCTCSVLQILQIIGTTILMYLDRGHQQQMHVDALLSFSHHLTRLLTQICLHGRCESRTGFHADSRPQLCHKQQKILYCDFDVYNRHISMSMMHAAGVQTWVQGRHHSAHANPSKGKLHQYLLVNRCYDSSG